MTEQSFTLDVVVDRSPAEVFAAVVDATAWWSREIDGDTDRLDAEFDYHYLDRHRCRLRVTELVPGRRVAWLVLDNHFGFTTDKTEWIGTTITFDIEERTGEREGRTRLRFTHEGLVPAYECFEVCDNAWTFFIDTSLRNLITTGEGLPNRGEQTDVPDLVVSP